MAKIKNNPILQGLSGKLGETHMYKQYQGRTIMTNALPRRKKTSKKQEACMVRWSKAAWYANHQMKDPASKAEYEKGITPNKNCANRVAFTDYLTPPVVHYVRMKGYSGAIGDLITIKAIDDFKVTAVKVSITNGEGKLIESGNAVRNKRKWFMWNYRTTVENKKVAGTVITVIAFDKPGNQGLGEAAI